MSKKEYSYYKKHHSSKEYFKLISKENRHHRKQVQINNPIYIKKDLIRDPHRFLKKHDFDLRGNLVY